MMIGLDRETMGRLSRELRHELLRWPLYTPLSPELTEKLYAELGVLFPLEDPYIEEADANPERVNNGCMIYRRGSDEPR